MTLDNGLRQLKEREPPWDEVREQRIYTRVRAAKAAAPRRPKTRATLVALAASAAVLIVGLAVVLRLTSSAAPHPAPSISPVTSSGPDTASRSSVLRLLDGAGRVVLEPGAKVAILHQDKELIELSQEVGEARYELEQAPDRTMQVRAKDVLIRVIGTVFTVRVQSQAVEVSVQRGVVKVDTAERQLELRAGEAVTLSPPQQAEARREPTSPEATDEAKPPAARRQSGPRSPKDLFAEVDEARANGDLETAANLLNRIASTQDRPGTVASALFTLGKVERTRGRHAAAAQAFTECRATAPGGPLAEDALAEAALSFEAAGDVAKARAAAKAYLERYPDGMNAERLARIAP